LYYLVFEYFIGYKLGLTATPKDYLKNVDPQKLSQKDPRAWERRQLLDTYTTFGCKNGEPTFRFSLLDGVKEGFFIVTTTDSQGVDHMDYIEISLVTAADTSSLDESPPVSVDCAADPINNPCFTLTTRISPVGHSR